MGTDVRIYGIRHHGPGSARSLGRALEEFAPTVVLIEGPPEADSIAGLAADPGMEAPVALLVYATGGAERSAFWPFAEFSPEWQAIRHAARAGVPVRFCDLPAAHGLAAGEPSGDTAPAVHRDPLGALAEAAGYDDAERWWEDVVEHRDGPSPFEAVAEAMAALREETPGPPGRHALCEERREAHMRRTLRRALREGHERVAVVCGAWHVPAVAGALPPRDRPSWAVAATAGADDATLRGLPRVKAAATWVPWTHGRLANWSGYGAGVHSPGWYHHLFSTPDRPVERWLTEAARLLRDEDLHVSSAHVIEAVRLAQTLAALRDRPLPGLEEVTEAARAVLCEGAELPLDLIQRRMVVGERLGRVPGATPMVPLQRDVLAEQRRLKLRPTALDQELDLDLRKPSALDRSRLLHRLRLLGVPWGAPERAGGGRGTFRETWRLAWQPEFDVRLIEASAWGTTVLAAATQRARTLATRARALPELTDLAERCLLAGLPAALPEVMGTLADRAAADTDAAHLMAALPALVRALRYGDVRGTGTGPLRTVVDGLVVRICVGLPRAATGIDADAARDLAKHVDAVQGALSLLGGDLQQRWLESLASLVGRRGLPGLLEGRLTRLLLDAGRLPDVAERMARAVSPGRPHARAAAWVEGFLAGGGLVLVHDETLLRLVDGWIAGLPGESFTDVLPLLRRAFSAYDAAERRAIGERVRGAGSVGAPRDAVDAGRAAEAVRLVTEILGWAAPMEAAGPP